MTTPEPVERAFGVLKRLVDRLDRWSARGRCPGWPKPDC